MVYNHLRFQTRGRDTPEGQGLYIGFDPLGIRGKI